MNEVNVTSTPCIVWLAVVTLKFGLPCGPQFGTGTHVGLVRGLACSQPLFPEAWRCVHAAPHATAVLRTNAMYISGLLEGSGTAASICAGGHPSGAATFMMALWLQLMCEG